MLLGSFIGIAAGASSLYFYSLGLFLKPLADDFHWSRGEVSLGPFTATLGAALFAAPTGVIIDRFGALPTILGSMILLASGFAALGLATQSLFTFVLIIGFLGLSTVGTTSLPYSRLIVGRFERMRGAALGIALTSPGVVGAVMPNLLAPFIASHGWRAGYIALAVTAAIAIIPIALLLRNARDAGRPIDLELGPNSSTVFLTWRFLLLCTIFFVGSVGSVGAMVHLAAMASDMGATPRQIGLVASSVGVSAIAGRLIAGLCLDRFSARYVAAAFFLVSSVGVAGSAFWGLKGAYVGGWLLGLSFGAEGCLLAFLVSRHFPPGSFGRASGGIYALFLGGGAVGQALLGRLYDYSGSYDLAFSIAGGCLAVAGLLSFLMPLGHSQGGVTDRVPR